MTGLNTELCTIKEIIKKSMLIKDGNPARYHLQTRTDNLDQYEPYRKITFGERNRNKLRKTILLVGETGTGKTTLINVMVNYMLGVKREDKVWFEITDDQSDRSSVYSQTSSVTVYELNYQITGYDLTIIDTPGYGDTRDIKNVKEIGMSLLSLSESPEVVNEIHAVCLVIDASQNRLSGKQQNIFDAVQSLFGRDFDENIVLLLTHSSGSPPKNALMAVKEAKIKCAVNEKNQPVYFLFNNRQSEPAVEEYEMIQEQSWNFSFREMLGFFTFLDNIKPKTLRMSQDVLCQQELKANISNLEQCVRRLEKKLNKLKQTHEALNQDEDYVRNNKKNFKSEDMVPYNELVDINPAVVKVMACTHCEVNCPLPVSLEKMWNMLKNDDSCKFCKDKCHYNEHDKSKMYIESLKKKMTHEDLKKEHDVRIGNKMSLVEKLNEELHELEKEKIMYAFDAFYCVMKMLPMDTHNIDSLIILSNIDFLTEKLKEINQPKKAETLEKLKRGITGKEKTRCTGNITKV